MKKLVALFLIGIVLLSGVCVFAEEVLNELPDALKAGNSAYEAYIETAIKNSKFSKEEIDIDNIYIIEKKNTLIFDGGTDHGQFYVALPSVKTEDIRFASFTNSEYKTEGMNTLSWLDKVETHENSKLNEYIKSNGLENVNEAVSMIFNVSSARASINAYKVKTSDDTYYIPYYIDGVFNPAKDESCLLELCKAYTEEEFAALTKAETQSYIAYKEAEKKAEEERLAAEAKAEEQKYRPVVSLDENGDEVIKVNGTNLDDVLNSVVETIESMKFGTTIDFSIKTESEEYITEYRKQGDEIATDVVRFAKELFEELKTQVAYGKPDSEENASYCKIKGSIMIKVWKNGASIQIGKNNPVEFKIKNPNPIVDILKKYSTDKFKNFTCEKNDENTPHIRGNIDGLTKTDIIEFKFVLPQGTDNSISKEVATPGKTVKGIFERYRENKYRSTYILTLSGNIGTISFCTETQSSLGGEEELFSNNIPVSFTNRRRFENNNIVEYKVGKDRGSYKFKMVFKAGDIFQAYFDGVECTELKYSQLTEDTKLSDEFVEKNKEAIIREAKECADTLYDFGLFKGTDKGYELEKNLTREESATILVRLLGEEDKLNASDFKEVFTDVDKNRWSYAYVMYCYENSITKGTGADTFSPDKEIDAPQFVTLMMRLLGYTEVNPDTALQMSVDYKLIPQDKADELEDKKLFTRSDMVQIVYNSLKTQMDNETVFADYLAEKGVLTETEVEKIK